MLDQNTDRMWYVIGAIVIGAAIIAMGLNIFSESFDSVDGMMANLTDIASENVVSIDGGGGIYSEKDIDNFIYNEGYIPIATAGELDNIRKNETQTFGLGSKWESDYISGLEGKYILVSNIDLAQFDNFEPIGESGQPFGGVFNGGGYRISNLSVNNPESYNQGLFGLIRDSSISNVNMVNAKVIGHYDVGSLVGKSVSSKIDNIESTQSIGGSGYHFGGVVGHLYESEMSNSSATGFIEVAGSGSLGGLVGWMQYSVLKDSHSDTKVSHLGSGNSGGLVGALWNDSHIYNSYAIGQIESVNASTGGLVGYTSGAYSVNESYYDKDVTNQSDSGKGVGKTTSEMKSQSTYDNWDFDSVWKMQDGQYPTLQ